ncbi:unnamed protein product, partial [marine sediment metagenome]
HIYRYRYGRDSSGIWLPELAYRPSYKWRNPVTEEEFERKGVEYYIQKNNIKYFLVDTPLLRGGEGIGTYLDRFTALQLLWQQFEKQKQDIKGENLSIYRPYIAGGSENLENKVSFLTRDDKTGILVWSGEHGFPGDGYYLEFHKKHFPSGNRYWRITGSDVDLGEKEVYEPNKVVERLDENSAYFVKMVKENLLQYYNENSKPGSVVSPYDFELLGHWWFEGVGFLDRVINLVSEDDEISMITSKKYLETYPPKADTVVP